MALGKPVISTSLPTGVPWVNETGIIVPPGDIGALRSAIERLVNDRCLAARIGAAGETRVRSQFTLEAMSDRLVALCLEVVGERVDRVRPTPEDERHEVAGGAERGIGAPASDGDGGAGRAKPPGWK
jgi:hypothetical protein